MERRIEVRDGTERSKLYVTPLELTIVRSIAQGKSSREIAQETNKSCKTVESQRRNILKRLDCKNMPHLIYTLCEQKILLPETTPELTNPSL
jgi:DNA-binding NarL/FixJ family response regulator